MAASCRWRGCCAVRRWRDGGQFAPGSQERIIGGLARLMGATSSKVGTCRGGRHHRLRPPQASVHWRPLRRRQDRSAARRCRRAAAADAGLRHSCQGSQGRGAARQRARQAMRGGWRAFLRPGRRDVRNEAPRQGEMHLRVTTERLADRFGVTIQTQKPTVAYRETIRDAVTVRGRHKKQSGGMASSATWWSRWAPPGRAGRRVRLCRAGAWRARCPDSISLRSSGGAKDALARGPLGFPAGRRGPKTLIDGSYHTVDGFYMAFRAPGRIALDEALAKARPVLLEPILPGDDLRSLRRAGAGERPRQRASRPESLGFEALTGLDGPGSAAGPHSGSRNRRPHRRIALCDRWSAPSETKFPPSCRALRPDSRPGDRGAAAGERLSSSARRAFWLFRDCTCVCSSPKRGAFRPARRLCRWPTPLSKKTAWRRCSAVLVFVGRHIVRGARAQGLAHSSCSAPSRSCGFPANRRRRRPDRARSGEPGVIRPLSLPRSKAPRWRSTQPAYGW